MAERNPPTPCDIGTRATGVDERGLVVTEWFCRVCDKTRASHHAASLMIATCKEKP